MECPQMTVELIGEIVDRAINDGLHNPEDPPETWWLGKSPYSCVALYEGAKKVLKCTHSQADAVTDSIVRVISPNKRLENMKHAFHTCAYALLTEQGALRVQYERAMWLTFVKAFYENTPEMVERVNKKIKGYAYWR